MVVNRVFCLKCVLWPADVFLYICVFKESERGRRWWLLSVLRQLFSVALLMVWWVGMATERKKEALWQGITCWAQQTDRSHMASLDCDEMLAGVYCKHCSRISLAQSESQRCETSYAWGAWPNTLTLCEDHIQQKLLKALLCLLRCRVHSLFLQNQELKLPNCLKFMGCDWFLSFSSLNSFHLLLDLLSGEHLSLLHACKPQTWWISIPELCCSVANK